MTIVAAAQIECHAGDLAANIALHRSAIADARVRHADILVFPELSLSDYVSAPDLAAVGMAQSDARLVSLAEAAGDMTVFVGFAERDGDRHFIATAMLARGRVAHVHRKVNLATYGNLVEGRHYAGGEAIDLYDARGWLAATLICADAWNPALPWIAALKGAELAVVPIASALDAVDGPFDNPSGWEWTLRQIAVTYGMPVVMANHCGSRGALCFWGGSRIVDPYGRELARAGPGPEIITATIDRQTMLRAREALPTVRDADPELVGRLLRRILER